MRPGKTNGYEPAIFWWQVTTESSSSSEISIMEQLGITEDDMKKYYKTYWPTRIGVHYFTEFFHHGVIERTHFITVQSNDD